VSKPRLLALCAGYGGLEMAVTALTGAEVAYVADSDKAASLVLAHHYPEVPNLGDISAYDWRQLIGRVDMVSAGFSCQDISNAGPRGGIGGSRSKVWKHVAEAVGVIRPRLVFLENVAAIRSRNRGLDVVAADLAEVGYDLWWTCLRASDAIGAAHHRDRWFGVARPSDTSGAGLEIRSIEPARDQLQAAQRSGAGSEDADGPARQERFCAAPGQAPRGGAWPNP
jgi:DNA (cytosine-5)-methyltransferase 1